MDELTNATEPEATVEADAGPSAEDQLAADLDDIYTAHTEETEGEATANEGTLPDAKQGAAQVDTPAETPQAVAVPATWGKDAQQLFAQLSPELQAEIAKRETEREREVGKVVAEREAMKQAMRPVVEGFQGLQGYFQAFQGPDGKALWGNPQAMMKEIGDVLAVKALMLQNPQAGLQAVLQWAQQAGLDLSGEGKQAADPEVLKMRQQIARLEADNQRRATAEQEQQAYAQRQEAIQRVAVGLSEYAEAKDAAGQPLYPHLFGEHGGEVGELMGRWIRANVGPDGLTPEVFRQAYEVASLSVPATREAEFVARENARVAQFKERSARARKAAGINPGPKRSPDIDPQKTEEELQDEIWRRYNAS